MIRSIPVITERMTAILTLTLASLITMILLGGYDYYLYQNAPCGHPDSPQKLPPLSSDLTNALWQYQHYHQINHVSLLLTLLKKAEDLDQLKITYLPHRWLIIVYKSEFDHLPAILRSLTLCYSESMPEDYLISSENLAPDQKQLAKNHIWQNDWRITCQKYLNRLHNEQFIQNDYYKIIHRYRYHAFLAFILLSTAIHIPTYSWPFYWSLFIFPLLLHLCEKHTLTTRNWWIPLAVEVAAMAVNWYFGLWVIASLILSYTYATLIKHFENRYTTLSQRGQDYYQQLKKTYRQKQQNHQTCLELGLFDQTDKNLARALTNTLKN